MCSPPPRDKANQAVIWRGLETGVFEVFSSDHAGYRYDDPANTARLGGYATADLRLEYALSPRWTVQARATNLFDRRYETVDWYNQPGREYGVSVRYRGQ